MPLVVLRRSQSVKRTFKTKAQKKHMVNDIVGTPAPLPQQPSAVGIMLYAYATMLYCIESNDHVTYLPTSNDQSIKTHLSEQR